MKKRRFGLKNFLLKMITSLAAISFVISVCFFDTASLAPFAIASVSMAWIFAFMYANELY